VPEAWRIYVGKVDVDLPWWVTLFTILVPVYITLAIPVLAPVMALAVVAFLGG
jgi:hypothetical protein